MPESRDRLVRETPMTPIFNRRSIGGIRFDTEQDTGFGNGGRNLFGTPQIARRGSLMDYRGSPLIARTGYAGTPWGLYGNRASGQENRSLVINGRRGGRARFRNTRSVLPAWYPRRPLQDVTSVVNAIERRRIHLRETEQQGLATPLPQQVNSQVSQQELSTTALRAPLEHSFSLATPMPTVPIKNLGLPIHVVPKALLDNQGEGETDFVTPQKKLLNSIDQVEKIMKEEFKRMKRTPSAKKAERNTKVRTLMAMR